MSTKQDAAHRATARDFAKHGLAEFARAFNHLHYPAIPYRYSDAVQERFVELSMQLVDLIERGQIVPRRVTRAQDDADFQRHMSVVLSATTAPPEGPAT